MSETNFPPVSTNRLFLGKYFTDQVNLTSRTVAKTVAGTVANVITRYRPGDMKLGLRECHCSSHFLIRGRVSGRSTARCRFFSTHPRHVCQNVHVRGRSVRAAGGSRFAWNVNFRLTNGSLPLQYSCSYRTNRNIDYVRSRQKSWRTDL